MEPDDLRLYPKPVPRADLRGYGHLGLLAFRVPLDFSVSRPTEAATDPLRLNAETY